MGIGPQPDPQDSTLPDVVFKGFDPTRSLMAALGDLLDALSLVGVEFDRRLGFEPVVDLPSSLKRKAAAEWVTGWPKVVDPTASSPVGVTDLRALLHDVLDAAPSLRIAFNKHNDQLHMWMDLLPARAAETATPSFAQISLGHVAHIEYLLVPVCPFEAVSRTISHGPREVRLCLVSSALASDPSSLGRELARAVGHGK